MVEVVTDAGRAYLKPIGNRQGPHVLATDWVRTHLANWFGLSTFDIAIVVVEEGFELRRGAMARPGPAFAARAESGDAWGGGPDELASIVNPGDITRLVVFDTWTLNCDRHDGKPGGRRPNYGNVYLGTERVEEGKSRLIAMDHGLCFIRSGEDLTARLNQIDKVQEGHLHGLFPAFRNMLQDPMITVCAAHLREMDATTAAAMIETVPREWEVPPEARSAWAELIYRRAVFVADNIREWIDRDVPWFGNPGEWAMSSKKAFYSVVQYCPDRFRAETVNVGLVLYRESPRFLRARIIDNHRRAKRLFGISGQALATLRLSEQNLLYRLNEGGEDISTLGDLKAFVATRANDLRLTEPRLSIVTDIESDFARLFTQLATDQGAAGSTGDALAEVLPPKLGEVFYRLSSSRRIWSPGRITVPVYKRKLEIPYAYRNGLVNLVKPHAFPANKHAETQAASLAVNGDLIKRHPVDGENRQLIVVSTQETPEQKKEITDHVEPLFSEYEVRLIRPENADAFATEVDQSAH